MTGKFPFPGGVISVLRQSTQTKIMNQFPSIPGRGISFVYLGSRAGMTSAGTPGGIFVVKGRIVGGDFGIGRAVSATSAGPVQDAGCAVAGLADPGNAAGPGGTVQGLADSGLAQDAGCAVAGLADLGNAAGPGGTVGGLTDSALAQDAGCGVACLADPGNAAGPGGTVEDRAYPGLPAAGVGVVERLANSGAPAVPAEGVQALAPGSPAALVRGSMQTTRAVACSFPVFLRVKDQSRAEKKKRSSSGTLT